jgi:hypothetical protein
VKKRIVFNSGQVSERGTEVALFDYASANEEILGNESICLFPRSKILSETVNEKFNKRFTVRYFDDWREWDGIMRELGADGFYSIRYGGGQQSEELPSVAPSFIHCVFDTRRPYGAVYASISPYLNKKFRTAAPVMPHIVEKKSSVTDDLREKLGIGLGATVFGCYGGAQSFSVDCARKAVVEAATARGDLAFLFMNIEPFCEAPNVFFLPGSADADEKQRLVNSCDAMLHGRADGETFGLSVAEFFISGKPVLSYDPRFDPRRKYDRAHLDMLGANCERYSSKRELLGLLLGFQKRSVGQGLIESSYLAPYSRRRVMGIFDELFVSKL